MCQSAVRRTARRASEVPRAFGFGSIAKCGKDARSPQGVRLQTIRLGRQIRPIMQQSKVVFEIRIKLRHSSAIFLKKAERHCNLGKTGRVQPSRLAFFEAPAELPIFYTKNDFILSNCATEVH
jgi:hypothetical protein